MPDLRQPSPLANFALAALQAGLESLRAEHGKLTTFVVLERRGERHSQRVEGHSGEEALRVARNLVTEARSDAEQYAIGYLACLDNSENGSSFRATADLRAEAARGRQLALVIEAADRNRDAGTAMGLKLAIDNGRLAIDASPSYYQSCPNCLKTTNGETP